MGKSKSLEVVEHLGGGKWKWREFHVSGVTDGTVGHIHHDEMTDEETLRFRYGRMKASHRECWEDIEKARVAIKAKQDLIETRVRAIKGKEVALSVMEDIAKTRGIELEQEVATGDD